MSGGGPSKPDREVFIRSHYELIAGHATQQTAARWNHVQLSILAVSVFYAWLFGKETRLGDTIALDVLVWAPVVLALFGGIRARQLDRRIMQRNDLLLEIERHHGFEGWAHVIDRNWQSRRTAVPSFITIYWVLLSIVTAALAVAVHTNTICLRTQGCG